MIKGIITACLLLAGIHSSYAQQEDRDVVIKKIQTYFNKAKGILSYDYQLTVSGTGYKSSQTLNGHMEVNGNLFYDSCQAYIQVKNKDFVCQINREQNTISVVSFNRYKALTGMDPEISKTGLAVDIPMTALDSATRFKLSKVQGYEVAEFVFHKSLYGFKYIRFKLAGNEVKEIEMSMERKEGSGVEGEQYTVRMFRLQQQAKDALFSHSRFYKINNGKIEYAVPYRKYQHHEVI